MNIIKKILPVNFDNGKVSNSFIVVHTNNIKTTGNHLSLFGGFTNSGTSAHFQVMLDGTIEQYVEETNTAWHAGNQWANLRSIGIEHQDNGNFNDPIRTDVMYESSAQLVCYLCNKYNIPVDNNGIKPHHEFASTGCPGGLDINRIIKRAYEILNTNSLDNLYRVTLNNIQIGAFSDRDNAFNSWYNNKDSKVNFQNKDITNEFINMANDLQKQIDSLKEQLDTVRSDLTIQRGNNSDLTTQLTTSNEMVKKLQAQIEDFKQSFFGSLYFLFHK